MVPTSPQHTLRLGSAVGARIAVRSEQPSTAARLSAVNTISVGCLAALGLLGRPSALLRICWRGWHISLGYDAGKLGEESVGNGAVTAVGIG